MHHPGGCKQLFYYDAFLSEAVFVFFEPEWAESDSTLLFPAEIGIWQIRRWGGQAILYGSSFNDGYYIQKPLDRGWPRQPCWSKTTRLFAYLLYQINAFSGSIDRDIRIESINKYIGAVIIQQDLSHPSWSPSGEKLACYGESQIWIYDVKEWIDEI